MAGNVIEFKQDTFDDVIAGDQPVLADFWAEWCGPCRMLAPTIAELADEYVGKAKIGKINTEENRDLALKYGISAIPTILIFKDGEIAKQIVGLTAKKDLKAALDELIG